MKLLIYLLAVFAYSLLSFAALNFIMKSERATQYDRCMTYFRETFYGFDLSPEVCSHILTGSDIPDSIPLYE